MVRHKCLALAKRALWVAAGLAIVWLLVNGVRWAHWSAQQRRADLDLLADDLTLVPAGRALHYCNRMPDSRPLHGSEGLSIPPDCRVAALVVVTRHGDRTSIVMSPWQTHLNCSITRSADPIVRRFVNSFAAQPGNKVHPGNRFWSLDAPRCGGAQLTNIGFRQLVKVGQLLRERYGEAQGAKALLNCSLKTGDVQAYSSTYSRTWRSLAALLYGMWPEQCAGGGVSGEPSAERAADFDLSKVPMHLADDTLFCAARPFAPAGQPKLSAPASCRCARLAALPLLEQRLAEPYVEANRARLLRHSKHIWLNLHPGSDQPLLPNFVLSAVDELMPLICHNVKLPGVSQATMERLGRMAWTHMDNVAVTLAKSARLRLLHKLNAMGLLERVVGFLGAHVVGPGSAPKDVQAGAREVPWLGLVARYMTSGEWLASTKALIFSAHDNTLLSLLFALDPNFDAHWPPYSSRLVFELINCNHSAQPFQLRAFYNGIDITASMCAGQALCPFDVFAQLAVALPDGQSYDELCDQVDYAET